MKRILAVVVVSSLAVACGGSNASSSSALDERTRDAMPTSSTVAMNTPNATNTSRTPHPESSVGDPSIFLADTVSLGFSVNTGVIFTLGLIKAITDLPSTSCTATSCTWGPGALAADPVSWELVVTYNAGANSYDYTLSGMAKSGGDGQRHPVITGSAVPSANPHRGTGNFSVDFDESKILNPLNTDIGKLQVAYSNATAGLATINATFLGVEDASNAGQTDNALYAYAEDGQGGGSLQCAAHNLATNDVLGLDSRWVASGAGRADVNVTVADNQGGGYTASESECWASATSSSPAPFHVVYFTSSDSAHLGLDSGTASSCAFATAAPTTLSAP